MKGKVSGKKIAIADQFTKERDYWLQKLEGELAFSSIPADFLNSFNEVKMTSIDFDIDDRLFNRLIELSNGYDYTLHMLLMAGFLILLERYTGNTDLIVGMPVYKQEEEGEYINTVLALRNQLKRDMTFKDLLLLVRQNTIEAVEHQNYPLETLAYNLDLSNSTEGLFLFDTVVMLENIHDKKYIEHLTLNMIFSFKRTENFLSGTVEYNSSIYNQKTIERIIKYYKSILSNTVFDVNVKIDSIDIFTEEEKHQILGEFNQTKKEHPTNDTIISLFEKQVETTPDNPAVIYGDKKFTYAQLNQRADELAQLLRLKGVKTEDIVGLMVERSIEMIVGMLAIMKAGGAYLPIDFTYPEERIKYMIEDSRMKLLLVSDKTRDIAQFNIELINLSDEGVYQDKRNESDSEKESTMEKTVNQVSSDNLVYIIYTSGSTGNPKGVMVEHYSIVNTLLWRKNYYGFDQQDTILQMPSFAFDSSVEDIFTALISGSKLVMIDQDKYFDLTYLQELIEKNNVTHFLIVPNFYQTFLKEIPESLEKLRVITVAGENFTEEMVSEHFEKLPNVRLFNEYGPTENSVCTTIYEFDKERKKVLIGKPIDNVSCYILDKKGRITPIGVPGELCISGRGVTRGYYQRPELTEEKFVQNPYTGDRMYRTGDLARWVDAGNIEFLGRIDQQIKIRGFRVELGEIEKKLMQHDNVYEAVVVASEANNRDKCLIGYVVLNQSVEEENTHVYQLKDYLSDLLPDYMVPQYIIILKEMPHLPNGKINKKALPAPDLTEQVAYVAPSDEVEEKLTEIWAEILEIEKDKIGVNHDFFEMGGHSLKATTFVTKVFKKLNVKIQLSDVFEAPTIREIAKIIRKKEKIIYSSIEPAEKRDFYPLSSAQKRLFILEQFGAINTAYNTPQAMIIEGQLNVKQMETAFNKFIQRHEAMRTSFELIDGEPVQRIHQQVDFAIDYSEIPGETGFTEDDLKKIVKNYIRPFDLSKAPLLRVAIIKLSEAEPNDRYLFIFDMHHIVTDGVSMGILVKEIIDLYQGKELKELRIQYKDFAIWQNELFESGKIKEQEAYWLDQFCDEIPILQLPTDYPIPSVRSFEGDSVNLLIETNLTRQLSKLAKETDTTLYMVLLAAFNVLLAKYSGQEDIVVGSPIAGRPDPDLQDIMGMFVNTLALRNHPRAHKTFLEFLADVKEKALKAFENQDYQFESLVEKLDLKRNTNKNPLFDVMFVLQNMDISPIKIEQLKFIPYPLENKTAKFDLTLTASEVNEEIHCSWGYSTALFKEETINRMKKHFMNILKEITTKPEFELLEIKMMDESEVQELLVRFNDTRTDIPDDKLIHQLFEEQAQNRPDQLAVSYQNQELTYGQLNSVANQLARYLSKKGVGLENIVPVMVKGLIERIVGVLAVLKAGGAYLPIDPDYPGERIRFMLKDSGSKLVLTDADYDFLLEDFDIVNLSKDRSEIEAQPSINISQDIAPDTNISLDKKISLDKNISPDNLMYVIYTSGSTGKPKGVMVEHRSFNNMIFAHRRLFGESHHDKLTQIANFSFDAFCLEVWPALTVGAELYIADENTRRDPLALKEWLISKEITQAFVPTPMGEILISDKWPKDIKLKSLLLGGDKLHFYPEQELPFNVYNLYGPTEATVWTISCQVPKASEKTAGMAPPIGKPIDNVQVYILDDKENPVPVGVRGEIYIGGMALTRGYLNRPELTEESFVNNPFIQDSSARLYKTGDLGYFLLDGSVIFAGRKDNQVKIRGFRIELGEIESSLLQHELIKETVVIDKVNTDGSRYLSAYYVAEEELTVSELKSFLIKKIPDYMIPEYFVRLETLPLNANGKVDRKALPEPDGSINLGVEYLPPKNEVEKKLVEIWSGILGIKAEDIGVKDSFFDLGGNSLKIIKLNNTLKEEFDSQIEVVDLFNYTTIEEMAALLGVSEEEEVVKFTF